MLLVLVLLLASCCLFVDNFGSASNIKGLLYSVSFIGMVSCTMLFCLASGNFDLSVGALLPCAGVVCALVTNATGSYLVGIAAALGLGAIVGLGNGVVVAVCRINPLITTLASMQIVRGLTFRISDGQSVGVSNPAFTVLGSYFPKLATVRAWHLPDIFSLPLPVWMCAAFFLIFGFLLDRTLYGRNTLAIGGNEEASRLAGIPVIRTKIFIFVLQGIVAAFAGVTLASRMTSGQPKVADGFELEVIAACVLGGVSLTGGVGKMSFVVAGVLIMGIVQNAMSLKNINFDWQYIVRGSILLAAVLFDRYKQSAARRG